MKEINNHCHCEETIPLNMSLTLPLHGKFPNKSQMTDVCVACFLLPIIFQLTDASFANKKKTKSALPKSLLGVASTQSKEVQSKHPTKKNTPPKSNMTMEKLGKTNHLKMYLLI